MAYRYTRIIDFIYSSTIAYKIELGNLYARIFFEDTLIDTIDTPYLTEHLFELKYKQIADTMWIIHRSYKPRKLTRTDVDEFTLSEIPFVPMPFSIRNDINDPDSTTTLSCNTTGANSIGILTASNDIFQPTQVGTQFQLVHPRPLTVVSKTGSGTSAVLPVKGVFNFTTHGRWSGTVKLQRSENGSDWEDFRTYVGRNDKNAQLSATENDHNVSYRTTSTASGVTTDINVENPRQEGVVLVTSFMNSFQVGIKVLIALGSTSATKRWAEGAWSDMRGWPDAFAFYQDRAIYGGASLSLEDSEFNAAQYPTLRL